MSIDIKIAADYIPKDEILCKRCIHYGNCPVVYCCDTMKKMLDHYGQDFWSYITKEDKE